MEIRANYILVGVFTLLVSLSIVLFALWIADRGKGVAVTEYEISFKKGVDGLSMGSDVFFSGIRVGRVTQIQLSPITPGAVKVRVAIAADTPVRENSRARIDIRGLTGAAVISISGGTAKSPLVRVPEGGIGGIADEPSPLAAAVAQVPDVLAASKQLLDKIDKVFSEENLKSVDTIVRSTATLTGALAGKADTVSSLIEETERTMHNLDRLVNNADTVVRTDLKAISAATRKTVERINGLLSAMEPGVKQFSGQGLADLRVLIAEMRDFVRVLTRVGRNLEDNPRGIFLGEPVREYKN